MSKVAFYFKKWKNYARHKKLNEEWGTSLKDCPESAEEDSNDFDPPELEIFQVKFLGNIPIDLPKSEEATANAVKSIIATAKASNKKLQRVNLLVCPKGIEAFDAITGETVHKVSIYNISYCSADATHSNVFAFVSGAGESEDSQLADTLTCYAFLCQKRKVAHRVTKAVARSFERAYVLWQNSQYPEKCRSRQVERNEGEYNALVQLSELDTERTTCDEDNFETTSIISERSIRDLLIDFSSEVIPSANSSKLVQNQWVSFDEEPLLCEEGNRTTLGKIIENSMWEGGLVYS